MFLSFNSEKLKDLEYIFLTGFSKRSNVNRVREQQSLFTILGGQCVFTARADKRGWQKRLHGCTVATNYNNNDVTHLNLLHTHL